MMRVLTILAAGLLVTDVNAECCKISITKSRHLGADAATKTGKSARTIRVSDEVIDALMTLPSWSLGVDRLFLNKFSGPLDANQWAQDYWKRALKGLGIRHRKFYATRTPSSPSA